MFRCQTLQKVVHQCRFAVFFCPFDIGVSGLHVSEPQMCFSQYFALCSFETQAVVMPFDYRRLRFVALLLATASAVSSSHFRNACCLFRFMIFAEFLGFASTRFDRSIALSHFAQFALRLLSLLLFVVLLLSFCVFVCFCCVC